jgi:hypothetical protein
MLGNDILLRISEFCLGSTGNIHTDAVFRKLDAGAEATVASEKLGPYLQI